MTVLPPLAIDVPCFVDPTCMAGEAAETAANGVLGVIADAIGKIVETATAGIGTAWVKIDTPQLASADGHATPVVAVLQADVAWIVGAIAVLSILIAAGRAAWDGRAEPLRELAKGIVTLTLVTGCGVAAIGLLVAASDAFAQWVVAGALEDGDFGKTLAAMLALSGLSAPMAVIVLGFIAFLASLIQMALLVFRAGVLVVMTGLLPLAFSAAGTETGREWSRRYSTWLLALILYKPVAALIYAASFRLVAAGAFSASGLLKATVGVSLMVVAILALPALLRVLAPAVGAVHLRGSGAGGALAAAVPTGAMMVAGRGATLAQMGGQMPTGATPTPPAPPAGTSPAPPPSASPGTP